MDRDERKLPTIEDVMASPCTSRWLKVALSAALDRDAVDAAHDADMLAALLTARVDELLHRTATPAVNWYPDDPGAPAAFSRNAYSRAAHRSA